MSTRSERVFRVRRNRFYVWIIGYGPVPVATSVDDVPTFETAPPHYIGDYAIVFVEGQRRLVRLLPSVGHVRPSLWLVDMGPASQLKPSAGNKQVRAGQPHYANNPENALGSTKYNRRNDEHTKVPRLRAVLPPSRVEDDLFRGADNATRGNLQMRRLC